AGTAKVHLLITRNSISAPGFISGRAAIELAGATSSANPNITCCTDIGGTSLQNVISGTWSSGSSQSGDYCPQRFRGANSWVLPGYSGPAKNAGGQVETYLNGRNSNTATPFPSTASTTTAAFANGGPCSTP